MRREINGWHITAIFVAFFGTVMAVNFTMAASASRTFGGVVVENSYVASQKFNGWLEHAEAARALGWTVTAQRGAGNALVIATEGVPAGAEVTALARHPLGRQPDLAMSFAPRGDGLYIAQEDLPAGRWNLRTTIRSGDDVWKGESELQ
jgi:nitrogen fixation protein FixH